MDKFEDTGYIIMSRYRRGDGSGELENRIAYGPFPTKEAAEKANSELGFPDPDANQIIRMWMPIEEKPLPTCSDHNPVQHRDGKPPWCKKCGLTADFTIPESSIGRKESK